MVSHSASLPAFGLIAIGVLAPLTMLLAVALAQKQGFSIVFDLTLDNFGQILARESYLLILLRSLVIAAVVALTSVVLAYPVAFFLAFDTRYKFFWLALITLPFWSSYLLRIFAWKIILGYDGIINSTLLTTGMIETPLGFLLYNKAAVIITLIHSWAPFAVLPIFVSLNHISPQVLQAATDLGDSQVRRFFRLIVPLSSPGLLAAFLVVFIPTAGDYITPSLVGGPTGAMIGNVIFLLFARAQDWPAGAAMAVIFMLTMSLAASTLVMTYHLLIRWMTGRADR
ncbi:MAG: ABC transporter permease [Pseudomonadota bacterium]